MIMKGFALGEKLEADIECGGGYRDDYAIVLAQLGMEPIPYMIVLELWKRSKNACA